MTRRIYKNPKARRKKLKERALEYFRAARKEIDPRLLERTRLMIVRAASSSDTQQQTGNSKRGETDNVSARPVDRQKTIATIMKFMELKNGDKAFQAKMKEFLEKTPEILDV